MSIIYNVTNKVETNIAEAWLTWMTREHIPEIMATRCFYEYRVVRLLEVDDTDGPTYAIQYLAESKADYNRYIEKHAVDLRQKVNEKWGEQCISFGSVMAVVK
jgi:hypothetical protein